MLWNCFLGRFWITIQLKCIVLSHLNIFKKWQSSSNGHMLEKTESWTLHPYPSPVRFIYLGLIFLCAWAYVARSSSLLLYKELMHVRCAQKVGQPWPLWLLLFWNLFADNQWRTLAASSHDSQTLMCTNCRESQLSTGDYCIKRRPEVITHSTPSLIPANLHTTLISSWSIH